MTKSSDELTLMTQIIKRDRDKVIGNILKLAMKSSIKLVLVSRVIDLDAPRNSKNILIVTIRGVILLKPKVTR